MQRNLMDLIGLALESSWLLLLGCAVVLSFIVAGAHGPLLIGRTFMGCLLLLWAPVRMLGRDLRRLSNCDNAVFAEASVSPLAAFSRLGALVAGIVTLLLITATLRTTWIVAQPSPMAEKYVEAREEQLLEANSALATQEREIENLEEAIEDGRLEKAIAEAEAAEKQTAAALREKLDSRERIRKAVEDADKAAAATSTRLSAEDVTATQKFLNSRLADVDDRLKEEVKSITPNERAQREILDLVGNLNLKNLPSAERLAEIREAVVDYGERNDLTEAARVCLMAMHDTRVALAKANDALTAPQAAQKAAQDALKSARAELLDAPEELARRRQRLVEIDQEVELREDALDEAESDAGLQFTPGFLALLSGCLTTSVFLWLIMSSIEWCKRWCSGMEALRVIRAHHEKQSAAVTTDANQGPTQ